MPDFQAGRLLRRAVQIAEYGAQFLHHRRRSRDGTRPGNAGGGGGHGAVRADEPDTPQAHKRRWFTGDSERRSGRKHARNGVFPAKTGVRSTDNERVRAALRAARHNRDRGRGKPRRAESQG